MIKRQIPNLITLGNLLCGVLATAFAVTGEVGVAALFICGGIFLDFFDGLAARLLGVASPLGKELDSLADVVTSGVAPGFIVFHLLDAHNGYMKDPVMDILAFSAFLIPLFAAYRLAKFNIDTRQSHSFLGLPVPANALIWAGLALYACPLGTCCFLEWNGPFDNTPFLIALVIISLTTNILMVSEMPMFSLKINFKELGWKSNSVQYIFLIGCALIIGIARQWYAISLIILWYIILSAITQKKHAE